MHIVSDIFRVRTAPLFHGDPPMLALQILSRDTGGNSNYAADTTLPAGKNDADMAPIAHCDSADTVDDLDLNNITDLDRIYQEYDGIDARGHTYAQRILLSM